MAKKSKKEVIPLNYLDLIPVPNEKFEHTVKNGKVTILLPNKGIMKSITQVLLKKPKISFVHLDDMGNFVWPLMDGKRSIFEIGEFVKAEFGDKAEPLYERLAKYMKNLESYEFIILNKPEVPETPNNESDTSN